MQLLGVYLIVGFVFGLVVCSIGEPDYDSSLWKYRIMRNNVAWIALFTICWLPALLHAQLTSLSRRGTGCFGDLYAYTWIFGAIDK